MSIENELRKEGIEVIEKLDTITVNMIAEAVSNMICSTFPSFGYNQSNLFIKLSRLDMYRAKIPEGIAEANYFYKNKSIYFNEHIAKEDMVEFTIHECIHYLQEIRDKNDNLIRMGLCDYTEFKTYGLGLNEAAVQLMSCKINNIPSEYVKYFKISFNAVSPSYYPLECAIVSQMAYLVGEDILFLSTIHGTDDFKDAFISATSDKTFYTIQNYIDNILKFEENIIKLTNKISIADDRNKKIDNMIDKINMLKNKIFSTFIEAQNLIVSTYFDKAFDKITNLEELEIYRRKLFGIKTYLGFSEGYTFFNDYYIDKMSRLEHKYNILENGGIETAINIRTKSESKFIALFKFIKKIILGNSEKIESKD